MHTPLHLSSTNIANFDDLMSFVGKGLIFAGKMLCVFRKELRMHVIITNLLYTFGCNEGIVNYA
jgi:hypothetical protein